MRDLSEAQIDKLRWLAGSLKCFAHRNHPTLAALRKAGLAASQLLPRCENASSWEITPAGREFLESQRETA